MNDGYPSWEAIASAMKATATTRSRDGGAVTHQLINAAHFDRLLSRVFAPGPEGAQWLLKGGGSMLARVPATRATKDIDLAATHAPDVETAIIDLRDALQVDLGDHITFQIASIRPIINEAAQPGTDGRRLSVECRDLRRGRRITTIPLDLVVEPAPTGTVQVRNPANRLQLPKQLTSYPYRLYPIADHLADKVCAISTEHNGRPSSRVKDLIDIVVLANHETIDQAELRVAIATRSTLRGLTLGDSLKIPANWEVKYGQLARATPATLGIHALEDGLALARRLIDPALRPATLESERLWLPSRGWTETSGADDTRAPQSGDRSRR